jgi:N4-(beta-N-acetylglucosaminyl)-L-asparaginase
MVMEKTPHIVLAGNGALEFALANGFKKENLLTPESEKIWKEWLRNSKYEPVINVENKKYSSFNRLKSQSDSFDQGAVGMQTGPGGYFNHDTIGMLALDRGGNLSGACTTSGMAFKIHGRAGDLPINGAGFC